MNNSYKVKHSTSSDYSNDDGRYKSFRVKLSSNPDNSLAIISDKFASFYDFDDLTQVIITNLKNGKRLALNIMFDSNVRSNIMFLSKQSIKSLGIKLYSENAMVKITEISSDVNVLSSVYLKFCDNFTINPNYNYDSIANDYLIPYFSNLDQDKILTNGQILFIESSNNPESNDKIKVEILKIYINNLFGVYFGTTDNSTKFIFYPNYTNNLIQNEKSIHDDSYMIVFTKKINYLSKIFNVAKKIFYTILWFLLLELFGTVFMRWLIE